MLLGFLVLLSSQELLETTEKKCQESTDRTVIQEAGCTVRVHAYLTRIRQRKRWKWNKRKEGKTGEGRGKEGEMEREGEGRGIGLRTRV